MLQQDRASRRAPAVRERDGSRDDVPGRREEARRAIAQSRQQDIAGERDPQHGAEGVDGVERADLPSPFVTARDESLAEHGERRSHERGRNDEKRESEDEFDEQETAVVQAEAVRERDPEGRGVFQRDGQECAADSDPDLEPSVDGNQAPEPWHSPRGQQRAQRKARHEGRQNGGRCVDGVAEHEAQDAQPDYLVDEPGGPREEEAEDDDPGSAEILVGFPSHAPTIARGAGASPSGSQGRPLRQD